MTIATMRPEFVEAAPGRLDPGVLYVSITYRTTLHLCCCGCGNQVTLPIRPSAWRLTYDGEAVSLSPSVGNWSFPCRSHYWITRNNVRWAGQWTDEQVEEGRRRTLEERSAVTYEVGKEASVEAEGLLRRLWRALRRRLPR